MRHRWQQISQFSASNPYFSRQLEQNCSFQLNSLSPSTYTAICCDIFIEGQHCSNNISTSLPFCYHCLIPTMDLTNISRSSSRICSLSTLTIASLCDAENNSIFLLFSTSLCIYSLIWVSRFTSCFKFSLELF